MSSKSALGGKPDAVPTVPGTALLAPEASTAFLESGSADLDPSSVSNLFKNNASLSSE